MPSKRRTPATPGAYTPDQERAFQELLALRVQGAAWDTETTGLGEEAEIWDIAVYDVLEARPLIHAYVQPQLPTLHWEPVAFAMVGGMPSRHPQPWEWRCAICKEAVAWVPPNPDRNWQSEKYALCRRHFEQHLRAFPTWELVEPQLREAIGDRRLVAWAGVVQDNFDRRLWSQSRIAVNLPALGPAELPSANLKPLHLAYRRDRYQAARFPAGMRGGLERAMQIEGLKWAGAAHQAKNDAEAVMRIIRAATEPEEVQEFAVVESQLAQLRWRRQRDPESRDELVTWAGRQVPRWQADVESAMACASAAAKNGWTRIVALYEQWARESRTGCYAPVPDPVPVKTISAPTPQREIQVGDIVRMAGHVVWRYGKLAEVVDVAGRAPILRYKVRFADGDTLTYMPDCLAEVVDPAQAKLEGWRS